MEPWKYAADTTDQVHQAILFYQECEAVGRFPDDPIVRRCAAAIKQGIREAETEREGRWSGKNTAEELAGIFLAIMKR